MSTAPNPDGSVTIGHITVTPKGERLDASCAKCGQGMETGAMFGPIPGEVMVIEWAKQHTHTGRAGKAKQ